MRCWLIHIVFLFSVTTFGQKLTARISDSTIMIGEPFTVTYSVESAKGDSIYFEPLYKKMTGHMLSHGGHLSTEKIELEILEDFDSSVRPGKKLQLWKGSYTITCWDSGWVLIEGPRIVIQDSTFAFNDLRFECSFTKREDGNELYDIRERYAEVPQEYFPYSDYFLKHWYWIIPIMLLIVILIIFWLRRRKNYLNQEEAPDPTKILSLKERTILAIEALENEKLWEKDRLKDHFVELSYILRSYLTARYEVSLLEKTTYESRLILHQIGLEKETINVIVELLSQSDMVKFAKSKPDTIAILRVSAQAKQIVAETSPLDFDNVE